MGVIPHSTMRRSTRNDLGSTRRSEPAAMRQKHRTCRLTEDGKSLNYSGFRLVQVVRGRRPTT